jgi:amino acid adenylation domain-containing protein
MSVSRRRDSGATVVDAVRAAIDRFADHVAVIGENGAATYRELGVDVRRTAAALRARGIGPNSVVALDLERSPALVTTVLAVLETGAAVAPVDPRRTPDLRPTLLLSDGDQLAATPNDDEVFPTADDLAYLLHTSGTTGRPKPVLVPHSALAHRIEWGQRLYPLGPGDRVLHSGSLLFDFAFWEVLAPLCHGAAVVVAPDTAEAEPQRLARFIAEHGVTAAHFVPSLLAEYLAATDGTGLAGLRHVFCGGERLSAELAARLLAATPATVFNQYGPTEACVDVLASQLHADEVAAGIVPIGTPPSEITVHVLTADGVPVADDEPGLLFVAGPCLAWGYRGMGAATAEAFVPDPTTPGARMYRTGDLVRRRDDGRLEFLGRADSQLKIRGVRVEPADVEHALAAHPGVTAAVVLPAGPDHLVAHLAPTGQDHEALRAHLAERLPPAAVPTWFVEHTDLPRLPSGKPDRAALAAIDPRPAVAADDQPDTDTERQLARLWADVLGLPEVGRTADFFRLGGQSLLAMRLIARVRVQFGIRVPARTIFDAPTVERFGQVIDGALAKRKEKVT